jgi:hypothetical protein
MAQSRVRLIDQKPSAIYLNRNRLTLTDALEITLTPLLLKGDGL